MVIGRFHDETRTKIRGGTDHEEGIFITGDKICINGAGNCVIYVYIREPLINMGSECRCTLTVHVF